MGFLQRGQGPVVWLQVLSGLLLVLAFAGWGCAPKAVAPSSATIMQTAAPAACPPVADQNTPPVPAPTGDADASAVFEDESPLLHDMSMDADLDATEAEDAGSSDEGLETVEEVPSISDIVLAQYEDWRGVRYRSGGTDYRGVDCSGLVQAIFRDAFEVDLPRSSSEQARLGESVPRGDIRPGDLLYFIDRGRKHVGVAVNDREFVHASRRKGVIISKFEGYWSKRLIRIRRILDEKEQDALVRRGG
jgi:lipoprotein Spr